MPRTRYLPRDVSNPRRVTGPANEARPAQPSQGRADGPGPIGQHGPPCDGMCYPIANLATFRTGRDGSPDPAPRSSRQVTMDCEPGSTDCGIDAERGVRLALRRPTPDTSTTNR